MTAAFSSSIADGASKEDSGPVGSGSFLEHDKTCKNCNRSYLNIVERKLATRVTLCRCIMHCTCSCALMELNFSQAKNFVQLDFATRVVERNEQNFLAISIFIERAWWNVNYVIQRGLQ